MEKIAVQQIDPKRSITPPPNGKFHVRLTTGHFQNLRRAVSWPLIALFFGMAWLQWNGQPLVLFSFPERYILLFGNYLSWRDLPLLAGLLICAAMLLFFMAVAMGRVWCGFACPQSIWTWLFIRIEDVTEGKAHIRRKNANKGLSAEIVLRRTAKHIGWILLALATAITFTGYFIPVREIVGDLATLSLSTSVTIWLLVMAGLTYLNAGLVREKICLHACPYSRFQSVMFDQHTRTVTYDVARGEPRTQGKTSTSNAAHGDCVNCTVCVQVCPVGIDIRDGLQAACIDCGACIDACDSIMKQLKRAPGLIRFASEQQLIKQASPLLRPRLIGYGLVFILSTLAVLWGLGNRTLLQADLQRDRNKLYVQQPDDRWCNDFRIKLERFEPSIELVHIAVSSSDNAAFELLGPNPISMRENNAEWQNFRVCANDFNQQKTSLQFVFTSEQLTVSKESTFLRGR